MSKLVINLEEGRAHRKVSSFELARYRAGELDAARRQEIEGLLASDPALQHELDELVADEAAFRVAMPIGRFMRDHATRVASASPGVRARAWLKRHVWQVTSGLAAATAAALVLVVVSPVGVAEDPRRPEAGIRMKGAARIGFFVQQATSARWGADGESLAEGDRIQLVVKDAPGRSAMVIVGIDGRGEVSTYIAAPLVAGTPKGVEPERARLLEQSLILDDAVGAERFFVVYGTSDVDTLRTRVEEAARALVARGVDLSTGTQLPLSDDETDQSSVHIVKVPR